MRRLERPPESSRRHTEDPQLLKLRKREQKSFPGVQHVHVYHLAVRGELETWSATPLAGREEEEGAKVGTEGAAVGSQCRVEPPDRVKAGRAGHGQRCQRLRGVLPQLLILQVRADEHGAFEGSAGKPRHRLGVEHAQHQGQNLCWEAVQQAERR